MNKSFKELIKKHEAFIASIYSFFKKNKTQCGGGNLLKIKGVFRERTYICVRGTGNKIIVDKGLTRLKDCSITIRGNNNTINIGAGCKFNKASLYIENNGGRIIIGKDTIIHGQTHIAVIEGKAVNIGERCLFSANITLRTGDSHSILDRKGNRINPSRDIMIGNHVWIGNTVTILKGTRVNNDSVIATGAILTGKEFPSNSIVGGFGGNVLKSEVDWCSERVPIDNQI